MEPKTTRHLFHNSSEDIFRDKLHEFHDKCGSKMIMCGVGPPDCDIQTIKMAPLFHDKKYCQRVMGGMLEHQPNIHVLLHGDRQSKDFELMITHLHDETKHHDMDMTGTYLYQVAYDYPERNHCLYQFWHLNDITDIDTINSLWYEPTT